MFVERFVINYWLHMKYEQLTLFNDAYLTKRK